MKLHYEFKEFWEGWMKKVSAIELKGLADYYDKFITLFVIYNRLYANATFWLWDSQRAPFPGKSNSFPDTKAACVYVGQFLGEAEMMETLRQNPETHNAINSLLNVLRRGDRYFKLKMPRAEPDPKEDEKLLKKLESDNPVEQAQGVLEIIHCVRCNTFHGSKNFSYVQIEILGPIITLLEALNSLLRRKLEEVPEPDEAAQAARLLVASRNAPPQRRHEPSEV